MPEKESRRIDAFIIQYPDEKHEELFFTRDFLNSPDFDLETLKAICRKSGMPVSGNKSMIADQIAEACHSSSIVREQVVESLVEKSRTWGSIWTVDWTKLPVRNNACEIVSWRGKEEWYGPVKSQSDSDANWYVRPVFIPHWDVVLDSHNSTQNSTSENAVKSLIRWLCFARLKPGYVSLHWKSFTHVEDAADLGKSNSQFQYWEYIPKFVKELEEILDTKLEPLHLYNLILNKLWHKYRYDKVQYEWEDIRIRAESGGVALNARSARRQAVELDFKGIHRFAHTLRNAIEQELLKQGIILPSPEQYEEVILQTLIQDFGALSYEFSLSTKDGCNLFRGHSYFGGKLGQSSVDGFPHIKLYSSFRDDLEQLDFLLAHLEIEHHNGRESG